MNHARNRQRRPRRKLKTRGLVVTEGQVTEKQYVERLQQHLRSQSVDVSVKAIGAGGDPKDVVERCINLRDEAERRGKGYDWCVCLVDRDQHTTLTSAAQSAARRGIKLLVSNLKFEVWLLWHVSDRKAALNSSQLDRQIKSRHLLDGKHLTNRFPIASFSHAVNVAELADPDLQAGRVGPDPSTAMPILIALMTA